MMILVVAASAFLGFFLLLGVTLLRFVMAAVIAVGAGATALFGFLAACCWFGLLFRQSAHDIQNATGFLIEAALAFTAMVVAIYLRDVVTRRVLRPRALRSQALDVSFNP